MLVLDKITQLLFPFQRYLLSHLEAHLIAPQVEGVRGLIIAVFTAMLLVGFANAMPRSLFPKSMVMGCPRWTTYCAIFFQAVVYPACLYLGCVAATGGSLSIASWYDSGALLDPAALATGGLHWERVYLYAFFMNLMKDFFGPCTFLFYLHHATCMFAIVVGLFFVEDVAVIFCMGTYWFEFGSLFYNVWTLHPKSGIVRALYFTLFPLSNVVALYHLYLAFWLRNPGAWYSYTFMVIGPVLALMRQLECNQDIKGRLPTYGPEPGTANAKKDD